MKKKKTKNKKRKNMTATHSKTIEKKATNYSLIIPHDIHQKIMYWMSKSKNEVSGYGSLEHDKKTNTFTVKNIILLKQKVTPTSTELDPHAIGKAMYQFRDEPMGMKWHWHTHPNMGVFWSGDDMEVIRQHGQQGWILASVFNEKREVRTAFHTTTKVLGEDHDIFEDNIDTSIISYYPTKFFEDLDKEYEACVTKEAPTYTTSWKPGRVWCNKSQRFVDDKEVAQDFTNTGTTTGKDVAPDSRSVGLNNWEERIQDWQKSLRRERVYDRYGYTKTPGGNDLYNPLHDHSLHTDHDREAILTEMQAWEIKYLCQHDPNFLKFHTGVVQRQAATIALDKVNETVKGERT